MFSEFPPLAQALRKGGFSLGWDCQERFHSIPVVLTVANALRKNHSVLMTVANALRKNHSVPLRDCNALKKNFSAHLRLSKALKKKFSGHLCNVATTWHLFLGTMSPLGRQIFCHSMQMRPENGQKLVPAVKKCQASRPIQLGAALLTLLREQKLKNFEGNARHRQPKKVCTMLLRDVSEQSKMWFKKFHNTAVPSKLLGMPFTEAG
jgi:hypothetical protein